MEKLKCLGVATSSVVLIGLVAGCGSAPSSSAASAGGKSKTLKVVYELYGKQQTFQNWIQSVSKKFEAQNPGVHVQLDPINAPENQYYTKEDLMQQSSSTAPDIVSEDTFLINSDASAGYLQSLTKDVKNWPAWKNEFYPAMRSAGSSIKGTIYGIPYSTDTRGIYYDKLLFQKLGIQVPWQPTSWANILSTAQIIKRKDPSAVPFWFYSGTPAGEAATMQGFEMLLYGTKSTLFDKSTGKWIVSSPGFLHSLEFVQKIFKDGLAEPLPQALTPNSSQIAVQQLMPKQKVGMLLDGVWEFSNWMPNGASPWANWYKTYAVAKMPKENGNGFVTLSGGWTWAISSKAKHPNLSWEWIKFASNQKNMLKEDLGIGALSPRKDVTNSSQFKKYGHKMLTKFGSFESFSQFRPAYTDYPQISNQIQLAMEAVMTGQQTPQQAMQQYAKNVTRIVGSSKVETIK